MQPSCSIRASTHRVSLRYTSLFLLQPESVCSFGHQLSRIDIDRRYQVVASRSHAFSRRRGSARPIDSLATPIAIESLSIPISIPARGDLRLESIPKVFGCCVTWIGITSSHSISAEPGWTVSWSCDFSRYRARVRASC